MGLLTFLYIEVLCITYAKTALNKHKLETFNLGICPQMVCPW